MAGLDKGKGIMLGGDVPVGSAAAVPVVIPDVDLVGRTSPIVHDLSPDDSSEGNEGNG